MKLKIVKMFKFTGNSRNIEGDENITKIFIQIQHCKGFTEFWQNSYKS